MGKLKLLRLALYLGAVYYAIGGAAHYFGLTIFPWYDGHLYAPYHDTVFALVALILALLLLTVARNPVKNIDTLNFVIVSAFLAAVFSIVIIWKVDFEALGAPAKKMQTIVEGVLCLIFSSILIWFHPGRSPARPVDETSQKV